MSSRNVGLILGCWRGAREKGVLSLNRVEQWFLGREEVMIVVVVLLQVKRCEMGS